MWFWLGLGVSVVLLTNSRHSKIKSILTNETFKTNSNNWKSQRSQRNNIECLRSLSMPCIKWRNGARITVRKKSHLIFICQGFVACSMSVLYSLFTTLILMACCKMWVSINTGGVKLGSHFPALRGKVLRACISLSYSLTSTKYIHIQFSAMWNFHRK